MSMIDKQKNRAAELIRDLLVEIGEDPKREGLLQTPRRVSEALQYFTHLQRIPDPDVCQID